MATIVTTAMSTGTDLSPSNVRARYNGKTTEPAVNSTTQRIRETKYRHVFATHAQQRTSCLSADAEKTPSFVGFRNLMILVLIVSNLRLMIENFRKVRDLSSRSMAVMAL